MSRARDNGWFLKNVGKEAARPFPEKLLCEEDVCSAQDSAEILQQLNAT